MDVRRAITSVRLQVAYAAEHGLAPEACLSGSDIDPAMPPAGNHHRAGPGAASG